jgi:hypothetical protein
MPHQAGDRNSAADTIIIRDSNRGINYTVLLGAWVGPNERATRSVIPPIRDAVRDAYDLSGWAECRGPNGEAFSDYGGGDLRVEFATTGSSQPEALHQEDM